MHLPTRRLGILIILKNYTFYVKLHFYFSVCDWPTVVQSIRPSCSGSKKSNNKKVFSKPTTILSNNKPKRKVVQHSTTKFPSTSTTRRTTTSTTTITKRTTSRTTTSTTTTTTTTTTSRSTSTTSSSLPTIVKGSNLISQSSTTTTTTKVPNRSFPKNSKITFIKPVIIHSPAFHNPIIHHGFGIKPKPKRKVKKKPMNFGSSSKPNRIKSGHNNNTKKDSVKNIYGYNSFFDISSLKVFTRSNTTSLMP